MLTDEQIEQIDKMRLIDKCDLAESTDDIEILEYLSKDEYWGIRYYAAKNDNAPISTLNKLSNDDNCDVRYFVAKNAHTPINILVKLSKDDDVEVRTLVRPRLYELKCININKHTIKGILE